MNQSVKMDFLLWFDIDSQCSLCVEDEHKPHEKKKRRESFQKTCRNIEKLMDGRLSMRNEYVCSHHRKDTTTQQHVPNWHWQNYYNEEKYQINDERRQRINDENKTSAVSLPISFSHSKLPYGSVKPHHLQHDYAIRNTKREKSSILILELASDAIT